jgi:predicted metal-dependent phosphoesterase TrpH
MLLCDFHIHTKYSDGSLQLREAIDLFGQSGHDVIAIADHVVNGDNSLGRIANLFKLSVRDDNFQEYMDHLAEEAARAWQKYEMLVIPSIEITKNHVSPEKAAHIVLLDIKRFISACWTYEKILLEAKTQDALIIACHPHHSSETLNIDTLFLWKNRHKYARYIDAWEIANRCDVFDVVDPGKYRYIANSDFHKINHLYSWRTLLNCNKDVQSVKQCIRENRGIAITFFRM